eukprot:4347369-Pleurochrysis_carterae.AAC.1
MATAATKQRRSSQLPSTSRKRMQKTTWCWCSLQWDSQITVRVLLTAQAASGREMSHEYYVCERSKHGFRGEDAPRL